MPLLTDGVIISKTPLKDSFPPQIFLKKKLVYKMTCTAMFTVAKQLGIIVKNPDCTVCKAKKKNKFIAEFQSASQETHRYWSNEF